ncbi:MAG TPA: CsbD family protein [Polyangiaceae bacterium]|nr:CsbD family protein [Polyangiaceae bacterium]
MIWNSIEEHWPQLTSQLKLKWAKLTDDDLEAIDGKKDRLVAKIQERYGIVKDDATAQVYKWLGTVSVQQFEGRIASGIPIVERDPTLNGSSKLN